MPELRKDPLTGTWVLLSEARAGRPNQYRRASPKKLSGECPFCVGHEAITPPAVLTIGDSRAASSRENEAQGDWRVRVVPNKYPALASDHAACAKQSLSETPNRLTTSAASVDESGLAKNWHTAFPGVGGHEVIIESPEHLASITQLNTSHFTDCLWAYRQRLAFWAQQPSIAYAQVFKNYGPAAGASLEHVHSQLLALPVLGGQLFEQDRRLRTYARQHGRPLAYDLMQQEIAAETRIVAQNDAFVAFCPFASRFAYETWVVPRAEKSPRFETLDREKLDLLAPFLQQVLWGLEQSIEIPAYNYLIQTSPFDITDIEHYHWHITIIPRQSHLAGFEIATGYAINAVSPESAANKLRTHLRGGRFPHTL